VRFIHKHKENITAQTRDGDMTEASSLQMLKTVIMDFSVIKPHFYRRLSWIFFSAGSRLSRIFTVGYPA